MFLDKLKRGQFGFFDFFNRHAALTREGTQSLLKICEVFPEIKSLVAQVEELEHECDSVTHMTVDLLHRSFITPLDRDEILKLISKMDDVMDLVDRVAKTMSLYELPSLPVHLKEMIEILSRAHAKVQEAVSQIPGFKYNDKLREIMKEVHRLENEGDRAHHAGTIELFRDNADQPLLVIKLQMIYESVEEAIDACEDIADIVESIMLEHF